MADDLSRFLACWFRNEKPPRKLVIVGPSGVGKTEKMIERSYRWARSVAVDAFIKHWKGSRAPGVCYIRWQRVCDSLSQDKSFAYLDELAEDYSLIFVDDIGAESDRYKNQYLTDALCYLLSICQRRVWLCLSTNEFPSNWAMRWDTRTDDRLLRDATVSDMSQVPSWTRL